MKYIIGKYRSFPTSKETITRIDIVLKNQTSKQIAKRVANIHGYSLLGYRTKRMTEKQYRKKYKIGL